MRSYIKSQNVFPVLLVRILPCVITHVYCTVKSFSTQNPRIDSDRTVDCGRRSHARLSSWNYRDPRRRAVYRGEKSYDHIGTGRGRYGARASARVRTLDNNIVRCRDDYTYALTVIKAYARDRPTIDTQGAERGNRTVSALRIIYFYFDRRRRKPHLLIGKHIILSTTRFSLP